MDILFNYISALLWGILIGLIFSGFVMYIAHKICGISYLISGTHRGLSAILYDFSVYSIDRR